MSQVTETVAPPQIEMSGTQELVNPPQVERAQIQELVTPPRVDRAQIIASIGAINDAKRLISLHLDTIRNGMVGAGRGRVENVVTNDFNILHQTVLESRGAVLQAFELLMDTAQGFMNLSFKDVFRLHYHTELYVASIRRLALGAVAATNFLALRLISPRTICENSGTETKPDGQYRALRIALGLWLQEEKGRLVLGTHPISQTLREVSEMRAEEAYLCEIAPALVDLSQALFDVGQELSKVFSCTWPGIDIPRDDFE